MSIESSDCSIPRHVVSFSLSLFPQSDLFCFPPFQARSITAQYKMANLQLPLNQDHEGKSRIKRAFRFGKVHGLGCSINVKYVSKVRGQLCDSRKSYIASVTIHPEGRQFHATDKICKKVQEIVYWCGH